MDVLLPLFQLMYFIIHFMYSLLQAVFNCCFELRSYLRQLLWHRSYYHPDLLTLANDAGALKKVPRHLAFLLVNSPAQHCKQIGYAVNWGIGYGIKYFTFYDYHGKFKDIENFKSIINVIIQVHNRVCFKVCVDGQEYFINDGMLIPREEFFPTSFSVTLNILSNEDGKEHLVFVAKKIILQESFTINNSSISSAIVPNDQPDPELAIVIGKPLMTCGLLPWHIRLTEFASMPSISLLDYMSFRSLMETYAKVDQRFGS